MYEREVTNPSIYSPPTLFSRYNIHNNRTDFILDFMAAALLLLCQESLPYHLAVHTFEPHASHRTILIVQHNSFV
jgi:hypothetical protein